jgi:PAS domain S-box-containing protein
VTFVVDLTAQKRAEKDLRDREQRLQAILDTVTDAVITIDHRGIMQSVNAGAERMFGYSAGEMTGQNVKMLMASPHQEAHDGYIARYLSSGEKHIIGISRETQAKRKGGTVFPVDLAVSEIENLQLFVGVHRDLTRRKELEQEVLEIANLEQVRIGQELHDDVGQHLTGLVMLVEALAQQLKEEGSAHCDLAEKVAARLGEARGHLRTLSSGLVSSEVVAAGLPDALENLAARLHEVGNVTCTIDIPDAIALADAATATHLFRIAQEAINNAVRHSQATHVVLSLRSDGVNVVLSIRDDGVGLPATAHASRGLGIRLMRNRASLIGGRLSIGPGENGGTLVACTLPLQR